jgi:hypothetical protein
VSKFETQTLQCSNNKEWKLYLIKKKGSMGKERTWKCEKKRTRNESQDKFEKNSSLDF